MANIKPLPENTPQISPIKLTVLVIIVIGALALGITLNTKKQNSNPNILGEETVDVVDVARGELGQAILGDNATILNDANKSESLIKGSQELLASKAAELGNMANMSVEKVSSDAAHNVTDFIYRNTLERMIDTLINSLPEERQEKYK